MTDLKIKVAYADSASWDTDLPKLMTSGASGFDLRANIPAGEMGIFPNRVYFIKTGLRFEIPPGYEMQVRPRSGLAHCGVIVMNSPGTIDSDYRGEVGVLIMTIPDSKIDRFHHGDRIAQGVICPVVRPDFVVVDELSATDRGTAGLGSTGDEVMMIPIPFTTDLMAKILDHTKTVTRRPPNSILSRAAAGDKLWCRETHRCTEILDNGLCRIQYLSDGDDLLVRWPSRCILPLVGITRPPMHMPREAARVFLHVERVSKGMVKAITEKDSIREGFPNRRAFLDAWREIYGKEPDCVRIGFWTQEVMVDDLP